jgi:predicted MFS family arabinose efflux permease
VRRLFAGFVGQYFGWRAIFGSMAVAAGLLMILVPLISHLSTV